MEFARQRSSLAEIAADAVVIHVFKDEAPDRLLSKLDKSLPAKFLKAIAAACTAERFDGNYGQFLSLPTYGAMPYSKLIICGLGAKSDYKPSQTRKLTANIARGKTNHASSVCLFLPSGQGEEEHLQAAVEGWILGSYSFKKYKSNRNDSTDTKATQKITIGGITLPARTFKDVVHRAAVIADSTNYARDLIAEPASYMTPTQLARQAAQVAKETGLACTVMSEKEMDKEGMGAILGVAKGSAEPAKFIVLKYACARAKKTVALVGKGITFDSGGLSIKPAASMEHMKYDMSGAACVMATMRMVGLLKPSINVVGLIAATENMPGGTALRPGDVLTTMNGKTVEVNNTDAEGRLILADALCYALKLHPDAIIDIATLTGGVVTALGRAAAGIMGNDQKLIDQLIESATAAGESLWQLPLFDEYKEYLKSDIADLKNAGSKGEASSSAGGMFLKEFVDGHKWAHLDIAGPGWADKEKDEINKGGTAFGVRSLCRFLLSWHA